ncbi:MAG: replication protein RepA [Terracidiphilus sp.]
MGEIHDILAAKGKLAALEGGHHRNVVEAAAAYMGNEESGTGFLYSGWCQSALPHKRQPDDMVWRFDSDRVSLLVEPGARIEGNGTVRVGVPFGSRARLILIYLQTEALRTGKSEVELGRSLRQWFIRMGISMCGKNVAAVRDQAERISRCRLSFQFTTGKRVGLVQQNIVETAMFVEDDDVRQGSLFTEKARLSDSFFRELQKHPMPIEDAAIKALSNNSQAIDIYCWLAYRLHVLKGPTPISWQAAKQQFGQSVGRMIDFRRRFLPNLALAMAVYPDAKIEQTDDGLLLHPSRPPVAPRMIAVS